jgi:hypothetical protein
LKSTESILKDFFQFHHTIQSDGGANPRKLRSHSLIHFRINISEATVKFPTGLKSKFNFADSLLIGFVAVMIVIKVFRSPTAAFLSTSQSDCFSHMETLRISSNAKGVVSTIPLSGRRTYKIWIGGASNLKGLIWKDDRSDQQNPLTNAKLNPDGRYEITLKGLTNPRRIRFLCDGCDLHTGMPIEFEVLGSVACGYSLDGDSLSPELNH